MQTLCLELDPVHPDPAVLGDAARLLHAGELVAFPTETVYGLGANALDPGAVAKIYAAKGRPATNPLIVHVARAEQAQELVSCWPPAIARLVERAWPGPLTVVLPRTRRIPDIVTAGLDQVGIRIPAHPVARALLEYSALPVAAPSANRSEHISPTRAWHVMSSLGGRIPMVLDGGACQVGLESTVVRYEPDGSLSILRPGLLGAETLARWAGTFVRHLHVEGSPDRHLPSPGQDLRHYAPDTPTHIVRDIEAVAARGNGPIGVIACVSRPSWFTGSWIALEPRPEPYAMNLYDSLHELDRQDLSCILIVAPPRTHDWEAIWDRIRRADADHGKF